MRIINVARCCSLTLIQLLVLDFYARGLCDLTCDVIISDSFLWLLRSDLGVVTTLLSTS